MVLRKRIFRDLKSNFLRYFAVFCVVAIAMYVVVGMAGAAETVMIGVEKHASQNAVEDGQFTLFSPLTDEEKDKLEDDGATLEEHFNIDFSVNDSTLRIFKDRENIDLLEVDEGDKPSGDREVVLEKKYCDANSIEIGDSITIGDLELKVVGYGSTPDYDDVLKTLADASSKSESFGTAFVSNECYKDLLDTKKALAKEEILYSYKLNGEMDEDKFSDKLKETTEGPKNAKNVELKNTKLKSHIAVADNARINASADDIQINKKGALIAGAIVLILLAYVLSAFATNTIESERKIIGTLYSMGFVKRELLRNYVVLPVLVCTFGGALGTVAGFLNMDSQIAENSGYFSYPVLEHQYPAYLIIYGIFVPFIMSLVVNTLLINKKLSEEPLTLMSKQQKSYTGKGFDLGKMKFINRFRLRLFVREIKSNLTIAAGMFISLLLVMLAVTIYSATTTIIKETDRDIHFNYMYYLTYPDNDISEDAEKAYIEKFSKDRLNYSFDVSLMGLEKDSEAFPFDVETSETEVYISTSVAEKYDIKVGDTLDLTDKVENVTYNFKIKKVVDYAPGLFVFMDIDSMRERFNKDENYYNTLLSNNELDIDNAKIYSTISAQDLRDASEIFWSLMKKLVYLLVVASVILFVLVMYLMVKMIIERQTNNISMFKLFGYTRSEISQLYLRNNAYIVVISSVIFIPITKWIIAKIYPFLTSNRSVGFNLSFSNNIYIFLICVIFVSYALSYLLSMLRLNQVEDQEVLKERE